MNNPYLSDSLENNMFPWTDIMAQGTPQGRKVIIEQAIEECLSKYGTLPLEEFLLYKEVGGAFALEYLGSQMEINPEFNTGAYVLRCVKFPQEGRPDQFRDPKPGDVYWFCMGQKTHYNDPAKVKPVPHTTKSLARNARMSKARGDQLDPNIWAKLELDDNCCVMVKYHTAITILLTLSSNGPHSRMNSDQWLFVQELKTEALDSMPSNKKPGRPKSIA
jgi:hypothetical protein